MTEAIAVIRTALPTILAADQNDILGKLAEKVQAHKPDVSTERGRSEIRSLAAEIASSKVALVKLGKSLTEDWRNKTKAVNAECSVIEERMDALKAQVRQPLTDFENIEKARVAAHETALEDLISFGVIPAGWPSGHIATRLEEFRSSDLRVREWQEFQQRASTAFAEVQDMLANAHTIALNRETQEAEFARLKAEEAERQRLAAIEARRVREEQIAREAADRATREAEAKAAREAEAARQAAQRAQDEAERAAQKADYHRRMLQHVKGCGLGFIDDQPQPYGILLRELTHKITYDAESFGDLLPDALRARDEALERINHGIKKGIEREEAERKAQAERDAAAKRERDAAAALERAEERRKQQAEQAERDRLQAIADERRKIAEEKAAEEAKAKARAANIAHRKGINNEAMTGLMMAMANDHTGTAEEAEKIARAIVTAVAKGEIRHMKMEY